MIVTIDGPSGAGKGTISQLLANKLDAELLDSGALYRLVALVSLKRGIDAGDTQALAEQARRLNVQFVTGKNGILVQLDGEDVSQAIRDEQVGIQASKIAAIPEVREALLQRQRDFAKAKNLVADGRDMGTTVFPDADVKFFLTASPRARAERRYRQLTERGEQVDLEKLIQDIIERDLRDQSRTTSPLKPAPDAILVDSTEMGIDEVLAFVLKQIKSA